MKKLHGQIEHVWWVGGGGRGGVSRLNLNPKLLKYVRKIKFLNCGKCFPQHENNCYKFDNGKEK